MNKLLLMILYSEVQNLTYVCLLKLLRKQIIIIQMSVYTFTGKLLATISKEVLGRTTVVVTRYVST